MNQKMQQSNHISRNKQRNINIRKYNSSTLAAKVQIKVQEKLKIERKRSMMLNIKPQNSINVQILNPLKNQTIQHRFEPVSQNISPVRGICVPDFKNSLILPSLTHNRAKSGLNTTFNTPKHQNFDFVNRQLVNYHFDEKSLQQKDRTPNPYLLKQMYLQTPLQNLGQLKIKNLQSQNTRQNVMTETHESETFSKTPKLVKLKSIESYAEDSNQGWFHTGNKNAFQQNEFSLRQKSEFINTYLQRTSKLSSTNVGFMDVEDAKTQNQMDNISLLNKSECQLNETKKSAKVKPQIAKKRKRTPPEKMILEAMEDDISFKSRKELSADEEQDETPSKSINEPLNTNIVNIFNDIAQETPAADTTPEVENLTKDQSLKQINSPFLSKYEETLKTKKHNLRIVNAQMLVQKDKEDEFNERLEALVVSDELYTEKLNENEIMQIEDVKKTTQQILQDLDFSSKDTVQVQKFRKHGHGEMYKLSRGNKVEYILRKYLDNLKIRISLRQKEEARLQKDRLVNNIMKKLTYNRSLKMITAEKKSKLNNDGKQNILNNKVLRSKQFNFEKKGTKRSWQNIKTLESRKNSMVTDSSYSDDSSSSYAQEEDEIDKMQSQLITTDQQDDYMNYVKENNFQPLPILNRISERGELFLLNYQMNQKTQETFGGSMVLLIPSKLKRLTLMDNNLVDKNVASIFESLSGFQDGGITSLALIKNQIGNLAVESMANYFFASHAVLFLKKFHIKNPIVVSKNLQMKGVFLQMQEKAPYMKTLTTLGFSQVRISKDCVLPLAESIKSLKSLKFLDISATNLDGQDIYTILSKIDGENQLRSINLSYNTVKQINTNLSSPHSVVRKLAHFIHYSDNLIHIDLGGMNFMQTEIEHLFKYGLRKSRTLQSCHFVGANNSFKGFNSLLNILKIKPNQHQKYDPYINQNEYDLIFQGFKIQTETKSKQLTETTLKQKSIAKTALKEPLFEVYIPNRLVFERILGHPEIIGANKWVNSNELKCKVCSKQSYSIFVWNKRIQADTRKRFKYYKQAYGRPIKYEDDQFINNHPLILINQQIHKMVPLGEFIERLEESKNTSYLSHRPCDSLLESKIEGILENKIRDSMGEKILHPTFRQEIIDSREEVAEKQEEVRKETTDSEDHISQDPAQIIHPKLPERLQKIAEWDSYLLQNIPDKSFCPINLQDYHQMMTGKYEIVHQYSKGIYKKNTEQDIINDNHQIDMLRLESIAEETYVASCFLPCHYDHDIQTRPSGHKVEVLVYHPEMKNVDVICIPEIPKQTTNKHLSLHSMHISYKQLKQVSKARSFDFHDSVFAQWRRDDDKIFNKAFIQDSTHLKLSKFIKEKDDLENTKQCLRQNFELLLEQFQNLICSFKFYPSVTWMEFSDAVSKWRMIDKHLTSQDTDRAFVAVNFDSEALEGNDENSLCRYEFLEIIVRLAKIKYLEKGICLTHVEATKKLIDEYLIPYQQNKMNIPSKEWRLHRYWTLEVDDLYKENLQSIDQLYHFTKTGPHTRTSKDLEFKDACELLKIAGIHDHEKVGATAYALSKMTLIDEMAEFENYEKMLPVEFKEFLARVSDLIYPGDGPLQKKLEKLLATLFTIINEKVSIPKVSDHQESDSDCPDDLIDDIKEKIYEEMQI